MTSLYTKTKSSHWRILLVIALCCCVGEAPGHSQSVTNTVLLTNLVLVSQKTINVAVNPALNKIYLSDGADAQGAAPMVLLDGATFSQLVVSNGSGADVDVTNNNYWSTGVGLQTVTVWNSNNLAITNIHLGYCPMQVDIDAPHRRAWISAQCGGGNDPIWAINADTYAVVAGPFGSVGIQSLTKVNPATGRFYLSPNSVSKRINPANGFALTTNRFGVVVGVNALANLLYALTNGNTLQIVNGAPDPEVVVTNIILPFSFQAGGYIDVNPVLNRLYIGNAASNTVAILNASTGDLLDNFSLGGGITSVENIAADTLHNRAYIVSAATNRQILSVLEERPLIVVNTNTPIVNTNISIPAMTGRLMITLTPPEANGQWRFPWELGWHSSGEVVSNLSQGNYDIQFRPVPGWLAIPSSWAGSNAVAVLTNGPVTSLTNQYYPTLSVNDTGNGGALSVSIGPNIPSGAGWRFIGEVQWRAPGVTVSSLVPDTYFVEFAPVSGYALPASRAVQVSAGVTTFVSANYLLASSAPPGVDLPHPVATNAIPDLAHFPYQFNGQLQSDAGYGSGVAVQPSVVLTAAHLVFNDTTLSYVSQLYWRFQREAGVFEPVPLPARGWYALSGYAAQRTNDLGSGLYGPGQSTPQSRNLDVAAVYFNSPVAGGGYENPLPSDAVPNPWLTNSTSQKMLVGYPVDGSMFGTVVTPGVMYQAGPETNALAIATDPVANQQVYTATWLLSYPGNSGGPLYVQNNGYYYPAAIYLGTLYNGTQPYASLVRAIDSTVVNLITLATTLRDTGTNNTGGGVITIIPAGAVSAIQPAYLQFHLAPPAAVAAGAGWRLSTGPPNVYGSDPNYTLSITSTNAVTVLFKPLPGWNLPTNQSIHASAGTLTVDTGFYSVTNPVMLADRVQGIGMSGTPGTAYRIERSASLTTGSWIPLSTNTITTPGFNRVLTVSATNGAPSYYRALWLP